MSCGQYYESLYPLRIWWTVFSIHYTPNKSQNKRSMWRFNILRPRQDGRQFPDDIFICIFLNENEWHLIKISLKFVPKVPINNIPALVQIMAWRRPGDKPLSEPMLVSLLTHICVARPQWVNTLRPCNVFIHPWIDSSLYPRSMKWKGGILVSPCPSVRLCPSVDIIVSTLYLL